MDLEELAKYAQIIKIGIIVLGGSALGVLIYKIRKETKKLAQAQGELESAQGALAMAENLGGKTKYTYKDLIHFRDEEYPSRKVELEQMQKLPEKYQEGIFEIEKKGQVEDFGTYLIKRTEGLVEAIEDSSKLYSSAASFVKDKDKTVSNIKLKTERGSGIVDFPRQLSDSERNVLVGRNVAYEEKYNCYDEGAYMGLLQGWHYTIEVLDGHQKGFKLREDITV